MAPSAVSAFRTISGVLGYIWHNPSNEGQKLYRVALAFGWQIYKRTIAMPLVVTLDNGLLYIADPAANNAVGVIYSRLYEPEYTLFLRKHLVKGGTMLDVGAQTGLYSLQLAHILPDGVCFEPTPDSFKLMSKNLRLNQLENFVPVHTAVSDREGTAGFNLIAPFGSTNKLDSTSTYCVAVTSLDSYLAEKPLRQPLGLLKIDVEGAEVDVLRGAGLLLLGSPTAMAVIENSDTDKIEAELAKAGWRAFAIDKRGRLLTSREMKRAAYNLLACGPSHPLWQNAGAYVV